MSVNDSLWHPGPVPIAGRYVTCAEQNGTMWKGLRRWVDLCGEQDVRDRLIGCHESCTRELYEQRLRFLFLALVTITSFPLSVSASLIGGLKIKTRMCCVDLAKNLMCLCSADSQTDIFFIASKGTLCLFSHKMCHNWVFTFSPQPQAHCLTSVEWDYQILFSCSVISSAWGEWRTYIQQSAPVWSHLHLWGRHKDSESLPVETREGFI